MNKGPVLIIGAQSDIGLSLANKFASKGYDIQLAARRLAELEMVSSNIGIKYNINVDCYEFDILEYDKYSQFIKNLRKTPEILICCVGLMIDQKRSEVNFENRLNVIRSNFEGPIQIISEFANIFENRGHGIIVGISSVAGERGRASNYIYGSGKAGFTAFLSGLRNRLAKKKIQIITVLPGFVATKMTNHMKLPAILTAQPDEVAAAIFSALRKKKNVIYVKSIWWLIMIIIKIIPEHFFKRMKI